MIEVAQLTKSYGDRKAIDELNFKVGQGEVVGFLGPNGAGKTTTMKIISGFMPATSGQAKVGGQDVFEFPLSTKSKIGYLPEVPPVYLDMTVRGYLTYVAQLKKVAKENLLTFVNDAMEKTHLQSVEKRWIANLSKGFRQRVGIAGALVAKPEILILDEPTVGLDPEQVAQIRNLILELKGEHTLLISTHILSEVQATCERVIIIHQGKIIAENSVDNFTQQSSQSRGLNIKVIRNEKNLVASLNKLKGVKNIALTGKTIHLDINTELTPLENLSEHIVNSGAGLVQLQAKKNELEEIFIKLTNPQSKNDEGGF